MDAETGFLIDGKVYEVPTLDSLTLDESELMYDKCQLVQEDFLQQADETQEERDARVAVLTRHPGFMASLIQIAYQRGNPNTKPGHVKLILAKTNRLEVFSTLAEPEEEAEEIPLELTSEPNNQSSNDSLVKENLTPESNETSGNDSENDSGSQDDKAVATGTLRLGTSSTLARENLVASGQKT